MRLTALIYKAIYKSGVNLVPTVIMTGLLQRSRWQDFEMGKSLYFSVYV